MKVLSRERQEAVAVGDSDGCDQRPSSDEVLHQWKNGEASQSIPAGSRLLPELAELAPKGDRRMGANPHANGGILLRDLRLLDFHVHAVNVPSPGAVDGQDTLVLDAFINHKVRVALAAGERHAWQEPNVIFNEDADEKDDDAVPSEAAQADQVRQHQQTTIQQ